MDSETTEQQIERLLKEQKEIRELVTENPDAYRLHLYKNIADMIAIIGEYNHVFDESVIRTLQSLNSEFIYLDKELMGERSNH